MDRSPPPTGASCRQGTKKMTKGPPGLDKMQGVVQFSFRPRTPQPGRGGVQTGGGHFFPGLRGIFEFPVSFSAF